MQAQQRMSPIAAGVAGAVVGGIGTAAAVALSNRNTRTKIKKKFADLTQKASDKALKIKKLTQKEYKEHKPNGHMKKMADTNMLKRGKMKKIISSAKLMKGKKK